MLYFSFSFLSCSEQDLIKQQERNPKQIPTIAVQPNWIDFGQSENQLQSQSFRISNVGQGLSQVNLRNRPVCPPPELRVPGGTA